MNDQLPSDWRERKRALDISSSFIVQAPAGSGKTELLVQRILALLAVADAPEEVLSITFTRKAAAEMRVRLLEALERAMNDDPPEQKHAFVTWQRSRAVLERDEVKGWGLLGNPSRLQLMTIDSFCAHLTRRMPWLARFGEQPGVTEQPLELYARAVEMLLDNLETGGDGAEHIEVLLAHLDNRLTLLRDLLVVMLGRRDQWLRHLLPRRGSKARTILESGLHEYVDAYLERLNVLVGEDRYQALLRLARYAAKNLVEVDPDHELVNILDRKDSEGGGGEWRFVAAILLTSSGKLRKSVSKSIGFPADKSDEALDSKSEMLGLLEAFRNEEPVKDAIEGLSGLPSQSYTQGQWQILEALIELLPLAAVKLQKVFRQELQVDFIEIAGAARAALGSTLSPGDLLLQLDSRIQHILVDEFQDTSYAQYELLRILTAGWERDDGRTLFVVGDPMQSIYRFREAEVGLYLRVCRRGLDDLSLEHILLNTNFRSKKPVVDWINDKFSGLFPPAENDITGAVRFSYSESFDQSPDAECVAYSLYEERQDMAEAEQVVNIVKRRRVESPGATIAVLVRSRSHLDAILPALKRERIPYQAQDLDCLTDRPVVQDILSLVRAFRNPADRIAWLAILRAPWCGLRLDDLLQISGGKRHKSIWQLLNEPDKQMEMFDQVSVDGRARLERILPVLARALDNLGRISLRRLVESTWVALGGPACVEESDLLDAEQVFALVEELGPTLEVEVLVSRLSQLFAAPDPQAGPELQLMTIHKAKGLEFDTVILPGLGKGVRSDERTLLRWLEHPDYELLLAPIPPADRETAEPTYAAIGNMLKLKTEHEALRLLYVAVSRAKSKLYLLGHAKHNSQGEPTPTPRSLLSLLWPGCGEDFLVTESQSMLEDSTKKSRRVLRRLPDNWLMTDFKVSPEVEIKHVKTASEGSPSFNEMLTTGYDENARVVGIVVHYWLEYIAAIGFSAWQEIHDRQKQTYFERQLNWYNIPPKSTKSCVEKIFRCLDNSFESEKGQWLLSQHRGAHCELAINGLVEGQLIKATIDRTFICDQGIRWVVDYKTSSPADDDNAEEFLENEKTRYREQLELYTTLMQQYSGCHDVRAALYFPMIDAWVEYS